MDAGPRRNNKLRRFNLQIKDATPVANRPEFWRTAAQASAIGVFVLLFIVALNFSRSLLLPVALAVVVGMLLAPLSARAGRVGIPPVLSALVLVLLFIGIVSLAITLAADPVIKWIAQAPEIGTLLKSKLQVLDQPLGALRDLRNAISDMLGIAPSAMTLDVNSYFLAPALAVLTPAIGQLFLFFATLFFFLASREDLRNNFISVFSTREARLRSLRILSDVEGNVANYLGTVTVINFCVGVLVTIGSYIVGLPNPPAWGVLAFALNYIPYLGPAIVVTALFAVGLISFPSLGYALVAPALYVGMATIEGQFVTPSIIGRRLTVSPLTVFLSLAFWIWLWGPLGALLAVPVLIVGMVAINHVFPKEEPNLPD
jgi:predicted PurR-regulated permease PerM